MLCIGNTSTLQLKPSQSAKFLNIKKKFKKLTKNINFQTLYSMTHGCIIT